MAEQPDEARTLLNRVGVWALANTFAQKFQTENAIVGKQVGAPIDFIPFGNVTVNQPPQQTAAPGGSSPLMSGLVAAALLASGAGGMAAYNAMTADKPAAASAENIPLTIDWEFTPNGGRTDSQP